MVPLVDLNSESNDQVNANWKHFEDCVEEQAFVWKWFVHWGIKSGTNVKVSVGFSGSPVDDYVYVGDIVQFDPY